MDSLEQLLGQLAHEGRYDSSGSFTLDLEKAPSKFRTYQGDEPALWFLLLAKAAATWESTSVEFRTGTDRMWVMISEVPGQAIQQRLRGDTSTLWSDPLIGHLALALDALSSFAPLSLRVQLRSGDGVSTLDVGPGMEWSEPIGGGPAELSLTLIPGSEGPARLTREQTLERLRFCPLHLSFDGRSFPEPVLEKAAALPREARAQREQRYIRNYYERIWMRRVKPSETMLVVDPLEEFAERYRIDGVDLPGCTGSTNFQEWCIPPGEELILEINPQRKAWKPPLAWSPAHFSQIGRRVATKPKGFFQSLFAPPERNLIYVGAVLRWGRRDRGDGFVVPIHRGVCLDRIDLPSNFAGCWAFVAVPDLTVDLSQVRAVNDARTQALRHWVCCQYAEMGEELRSLIQQGQENLLGLHANLLRDATFAAEEFLAWRANLSEKDSV